MASTCFEALGVSICSMSHKTFGVFFVVVVVLFSCGLSLLAGRCGLFTKIPQLVQLALGHMNTRISEIKHMEVIKRDVRQTIAKHSNARTICTFLSKYCLLNTYVYTHRYIYIIFNFSTYTIISFAYMYDHMYIYQDHVWMFFFRLSMMYCLSLKAMTAYTSIYRSKHLQYINS